MKKDKREIENILHIWEEKSFYLYGKIDKYKIVACYLYLSFKTCTILACKRLPVFLSGDLKKKVIHYRFKYEWPILELLCKRSPRKIERTALWAERY